MPIPGADPRPPAWRWLAAPMALALASLTAWRVEVELVKGWAGLAWLSGYPWAAPWICLFFALSALAPLALSIRLTLVRKVGFVVSVAAVAWVAFELSRRWFQLAYARWWFVPPPLWFWASSPATSVALTAAGVHLAIRAMVARISRWNLLTVAAAMVLVWPLSLVSVKLLRPHGYDDEIHAVKAGYPTFWVVFLIAVAVWLSLGRLRGVSARADSSDSPFADSGGGSGGAALAASSRGLAARSAQSCFSLSSTSTRRTTASPPVVASRSPSFQCIRRR